MLECTFKECDTLKVQSFAGTKFLNIQHIIVQLCFSTVYSGLNIIFNKKYSVFLSTFHNVLFCYQDIKLTLKKAQHCNMMWTRTRILNSYIRGIMQILLIQSEICHIFHYHVNIISRLMTDFVTELVEIVHFFSIVIDFNVQAMQS